MLAGYRDGSAIRGIAGMPAAGAGGVDRQLAGYTISIGKVCQNAFGKW
ncbi:Protein tyrosine phosphatase (fragment) [Agrobacterium tomkonis CFBP 6623]|uniref:Protein tyrosine phosphatase n=1 Tax=Agrobacterium tomkonis CFBP 6623 TaxID=1183432 RepID=A0A1S7P410_9HYPH